MEVKKIKGSKRGLTFSFMGKGDFYPGRKYRYVLSVKEMIIMIHPSEDGGNQISKKNNGKEIKSLIDIRSREVREAVKNAAQMEIQIKDDEIIVRLYQQAANESIISLSEKRKEIQTLVLNRQLLRAAGGESIEWKRSAKDVSRRYRTETEVSRDLSDVIRTISLFSGAGMLDYPFFADKHFNIDFAAEYDQDAVTTYQHNIGNHIHCVDIRSLTGKMLPQADLFIGGPPCQPFSNANRHEDTRHEKHHEGDMFFHYIRLIKDCLVKVFVIENVAGLVSQRDGFYVNALKESLPEYEIASRIVSDCDLGGFTKRKRAILIGSLIGKPYIPDIKIRPVRTVKDALQNVNSAWPNFADITQSSELVQKKISMIPEGGNWKDLPQELWTKSVHSNMYRRLDRGKPSVAIANWRKYLLSPPKWDDSGNWDRVLSVSEAAALQGFGENFTFFGSMSAKQQQVANGVTYAIGKFIKELVKSMFMAQVTL